MAVGDAGCMPVPIAAEIVLTDDERDALEGLVRRRTSAQALALRARIVLAAAEAWSTARSPSVRRLAVRR